jgi:hypothetical protein
VISALAARLRSRDALKAFGRPGQGLWRGRDAQLARMRGGGRGAGTVALTRREGHVVE